MTSTLLHPETTLRSLQAGLSVEYVRRVLEHLWDCERSLGDALVQVSLTSGETQPDYLIQAVMDLETGESTIYAFLNGRTHRELAQKKISDSQWSMTPMTLKEVADMIGEMRNFESKS
jgi:hypothetical protein